MKRPRFDSDRKIICEECGKSFEALAVNVCVKHGYQSADEYKQAHGYAKRFDLIGDKTKAKMITAVRRRGLDKRIVDYGKDYRVKPGDVGPKHPRYKKSS